MIGSSAELTAGVDVSDIRGLIDRITRAPIFSTSVGAFVFDSAEF
jgi:hypothetical protein